MLVYQIESLDTGRSYVGQTTRTIPRRWAQHCSSAKRNGRDSSYPVIRAIAKYGRDRFAVRVPQECATQEEPEAS